MIDKISELDKRLKSVEKILWKKTFRISDSMIKCLKRYRDLRDTADTETNLMGAPSREVVDELTALEMTLGNFEQLLVNLDKRIILINKNYSRN